MLDRFCKVICILSFKTGFKHFPFGCSSERGRRFNKRIYLNKTSQMINFLTEPSGVVRAEFTKKNTQKYEGENNSYLLLSEGGIMRPWDLRMCTSFTCRASLCTLGNGGTVFFVRPQPRHWHWNSTSARSQVAVLPFRISYGGTSSADVSRRCCAAGSDGVYTIMLTARSVHEWRLHMTVLLRDAVIDAIGHVLELPIAIVPTTFVNHVLDSGRGYRYRRTLQLSPVLVHLDRSFLPSLLLPRGQLPPLEGKSFLQVFALSSPVARYS